MILHELTLHNFRQYYGTQRIFFSTDKKRNITVIHGENGSGKTALLGSFNWVLYGDSTLTDPEAVISERAIAEAIPGADVEAFVTLVFKRDAQTYHVTRRVKARKEAGGGARYLQPVLALEVVAETGKTVVPGNPQETISQIIPAELRNYFFFDGERIDNLTKKEGAGEVKKAIKMLMGLEELERGKDHLDKVKRIFRDELANNGDEQIRELAGKMKDLEVIIQDKQETVRQKEDNVDALETQLLAVQDQLRTLEDSRELQQRRDELAEAERKLKIQLDEAKKRLKGVVSKRGYLAFCGHLIDETGQFLDEKRRKSEIPTGLKRQFVQDLLERGSCICDTPLTEGSSQYQHVVSWLERATTQALEDAFMDMHGDIKLLQESRRQLLEDLQRLQSDRQVLRTGLRQTQEAYSEVWSELQGKDTEQIADLTRQEEFLRAQIRDTNQEIGGICHSVEQLSQLFKQRENELRQRQSANEKAKLAKRQMEACEAVQDVVEQMLKIKSQEVQESLQSRMSDVHGKLLRKGYEAVIDSQYQLSVVKLMGDQKIPVRMSQGERQVTSLSFIGALVDLLREQAEDQDKASTERGAYYPIVMDSPFGQMDEDHRERTAVNLPGLAHQVVVLVSSSQWTGQVEQGMRKAVGREYLLEWHSPKLIPSLRLEYTEVKEQK